MKTPELIAIILTFSGIAIISASIIKSLKIMTYDLKGLPLKWSFAISLMILLLSGHIIFLFSLFLKMDLHLEIITGSALFLSSCLIYMLMSFTKTNIDRIQSGTNIIKGNEKRLKTFTLKDDLTGLYNRKGFITLMKHNIKLAKRQRKSIMILYADIDSLKNINSALGYQEGDMTLVETAKIMRSTFRKSDIVARIGDDEFAATLIGATDKDIGTIQSKFNKNISTHNTKKIHKYKLSLTYGISIYDPGFNDSVDSLLNHAVESMQQSKMQKALNPEP